MFDHVRQLSPRTLLFVVPQVCQQWRAVCKLLVAVDVNTAWIKRCTATPAAPMTAALLLGRFHAIRSATFAHQRNRERLMSPEMTLNTRTIAAFGKGTLVELDLTAFNDNGYVGGESHATLATFLASGLPALRTLKLGYMSWFLHPAYSEILEAVAQGCRRMERFHFDTGCWGPENEDINAAMASVFANCHELEYVNFREAQTMTDVCLVPLSQGSCPNLATLDLADDAYGNGGDVQEDFTDAMLAAVLRACPKLLPGNHQSRGRRRKVGLVSWNLADKVARAIAECRSEATTEIRFDQSRRGGLRPDYHGSAHIPSLTDAGLIEIGRSCRNLTHVYFEGLAVTDAGFEALAIGCPRLHTLIIEQCWSITGNALLAVAQNCPELALFKVAFNENDGRFSGQDLPIHLDAGYAALIRQCPQLTMDVFTHWRRSQVEKADSFMHEEEGKGDQYARAMADTHPNAKSLRFVASALADDGLRAIGAAMQELETIEIHCGSGRMTDGGIAALARGCGKTLRRIQVRNAENDYWNSKVISADVASSITDAALLALASHCPLLEEATICLHGLPLLTDAGREAVGAVVARNREFWSWGRHTEFGAGLQGAVETALLLCRRSTAGPASTAPATAHLPVEVWTRICSFLRSMDMPAVL